jgi:hypothetical protein
MVHPCKPLDRTTAAFFLAGRCRAIRRGEGHLPSRVRTGGPAAPRQAFRLGRREGVTGVQATSSGGGSEQGRHSVPACTGSALLGPRKYREKRQSPKRFCNPSHGTLRCRFSGFPRGKRWVSDCPEVAFISRVSPVQVRPPLFAVVHETEQSLRGPSWWTDFPVRRHGQAGRQHPPEHRRGDASRLLRCGGLGLDRHGGTRAAAGSTRGSPYSGTGKRSSPTRRMPRTIFLKGLLKIGRPPNPCIAL